MCGNCPLFNKELIEVFTAGCQHSFVRTVLLSFDQQRYVTELIVESLLVEFVQHCLAVFGQVLIHLALAIHL